MILNLKITDDTYEHYASYNKADPRAAMTLQLSRFRGVDPASRVIIIPKEERIELEQLLGVPLDSAKELVSIVRRLLTVKVGGAEIPLSPDQVYRIEDNARFHGTDPKLYLEELAKQAFEFAAGGAR